MVQVGLSIVDRSPQASLEIHFNSEQDVLTVNGARRPLNIVDIQKWGKSVAQRLWSEGQRILIGKLLYKILEWYDIDIDWNTAFIDKQRFFPVKAKIKG